MQHDSNTYHIYMARSGERQKVNASDWQSALNATGRADACLIERRQDLLNEVCDFAVDATFDADCPTTITFRTRYGSSDADCIRWALTLVARELDAENVAAGGTV